MIKSVVLLSELPSLCYKISGFIFIWACRVWADTAAFLIMNLYLFTLLLTLVFNQENAWSVCSLIKFGLSQCCQIFAALKNILLHSNLSLCYVGLLLWSCVSRNIELLSGFSAAQAKGFCVLSNHVWFKEIPHVKWKYELKSRCSVQVNQETFDPTAFTDWGVFQHNHQTSILIIFACRKSEIQCFNLSFWVWVNYCSDILDYDSRWHCVL